ncbi:PrsW family intramembrane metalloprotease [Microbacterium sp. G2-8]|uniref:PrsW family intramembrane metalloprotease n=1 Tax=Microbacterium sp. G2-8 TaxID=2842454 RepID=UPI001C8A5135|nr:PrsW family intramembrane metalloprotease [Microbacterium sp. G2-8]
MPHIPRTSGAQPSYQSAFAQPLHAPGAPIGEAPAAEPHIAVAPRPEPELVRQGRRVWPWLWAVLGLFAVATIAFFVVSYGLVAPVIPFLLALIPFAAVVLALVWLDRWEPEPRALLVFAAAWGGGVSIILTLIIGTAIAIVWPEVLASSWFGPVVRAPIVEELLKCIGILLILAMGRRTFDGALDGIVYGGLVGAGFAFVENIKYFVDSLFLGGISDMTHTFFLRAVLSPFAHIMFTAVCGFAVGLAVRRGKNVLLPWLAGLAGAILLHMIWNASSVFAGFLIPYVVVQMPLFAIFVTGAIRIRREELRIRRVALDDYVRAGWFTPQEADMLSTRAGRRAGLAWAATLPGGRRGVLKRFIHDGARLAGARHRALTGRDPKAAYDEHVLLARMMRRRAELLAPAAR